jgi:hypothetical protein
MAEEDITYVASKLNTDYIYAVYPSGPSWDALLAASLQRAQKEASLVNSFGGYRAVMTHFVASFQDAHMKIRFLIEPASYLWPNFLVRYRGGHYVVVASETSATHATDMNAKNLGYVQIPPEDDVPTGAVVYACDGKPLDKWVDDVAEFEGGPQGLDSTKAAIAQILFVDSESPLYPLPKTCRIGERDVHLNWSEISAQRLNQLNQEHQPFRDESIGIRPFGQHGAWVRLGTFFPATNTEITQFSKAIQEAQTLRDKDVVVLDVRGNAGGAYNWFMAFLRAFYGAEYADYYARARLEIAAVMLNPSGAGQEDPGSAANAVTQSLPPDPPMETKNVKPVEVRKLQGGGTLIKNPAPIDFLPKPASKAPQTLVKARVYVLTDYGCASACLSFVDEMMRFPGIRQIGTETFIDRRSGGWPGPYVLPSGAGFVRMGRMVRENRKRGENEPWLPKYKFDGDIADTAAVEHWIINVVLAEDRGPAPEQ